MVSPCTSTCSFLLALGQRSHEALPVVVERCHAVMAPVQLSKRDELSVAAVVQRGFHASLRSVMRDEAKSGHCCQLDTNETNHDTFPHPCNSHRFFLRKFLTMRIRTMNVFLRIDLLARSVGYRTRLLPINRSKTPFVVSPAR